MTKLAAKAGEKMAAFATIMQALTGFVCCRLSAAGGLSGDVAAQPYQRLEQVGTVELPHDTLVVHDGKSAQ